MKLLIEESVLRQWISALEETTALCTNYEAVEEPDGYQFTEAKIVIPMGNDAIASMQSHLDAMTTEEALAALAPVYVPAIYQRILYRLSTTPSTRGDLAVLLHSSYTSIDTAIRLLQKHKLVYIQSWIRNSSGPIMPVFALGNLPDARKLRKLTPSERSKRWRDKGNDSHLARTLDANAQKIQAVPTLANQLL